MDEKIQVGDELVFRHGDHWDVIPVERITPSGRLLCGLYTVNPDLTVRGRTRAPTVARRMTDEIRNIIREEDNRREALAVVSKLNFYRLSTDVLKKIAAAATETP